MESIAPSRLKEHGVKDCVKHIKDRIKYEKQRLVQDKENDSQFGMYEDCGSSYQNAVMVREARIELLVEVKISLEKYAKKLRHQAAEATATAVMS